MDTLHLRVVVPKNRNLSGRMTVEQSGRILRSIQVLARGVRGDETSVFGEFGNTPPGVYDGSRFQETFAWPQKSYGPWGAVSLEAISGDALLAQDVFRRTGLLIHGGTLGGRGYWRGKGQLRITQGCLRVSNADMLFLRETLLIDLQGQKSRTTVPKVTITVQDN